MRKPAIVATFLLAAASILGAQNVGGNLPSFNQSGASSIHRSQAIEIVTPAPGTNVAGSTVSVQFASSDKNRTLTHARYQVQLDDQKPIQTAKTTYVFDRLEVGDHTVTVGLLTKDGRVLKSSEATVDFAVVAPQSDSAGEISPEPMMPPTLQKVAMYLPKASGPIDPPDGSAEMPLLSVIGFGVLVGGIVSAMKTRG